MSVQVIKIEDWKALGYESYGFGITESQAKVYIAGGKGREAIIGPNGKPAFGNELDPQRVPCVGEYIVAVLSKPSRRKRYPRTMFWAFLSDWEEIIDQIQFEFVAFSIYGKSGRTIELVFTDSTMMTFFIFNGKEPWNIQFRYDLAAKGYTEIILSAIRVDGTIQDISRKSLITS